MLNIVENKNISLAICGKSRDIITDELESYGVVWTVGTSDIVGANRYYEFHKDIPKRPDRKFLGWGDIAVGVPSIGLPLVNSVCIMLIQAWMEGYQNIHILGSPLVYGEEYTKERPALAMCVGYLRGKGAQIYWEGGIKPALYML